MVLRHDGCRGRRCAAHRAEVGEFRRGRLLHLRLRRATEP
jgi:hypothetical protein